MTRTLLTMCRPSNNSVTLNGVSVCHPRPQNMQLLPFAKDVKKIHQYLDRESKKYQTKVEELPSNKNWAELAKITLCQVN